MHLWFPMEPYGIPVCKWGNNTLRSVPECDCSNLVRILFIGIRTLRYIIFIGIRTRYSGNLSSGALNCEWLFVFAAVLFVKLVAHVAKHVAQRRGLCLRASPSVSSERASASERENERDSLPRPPQPQPQLPFSLPITCVVSPVRTRYLNPAIQPGDTRQYSPAILNPALLNPALLATSTRQYTTHKTCTAIHHTQDLHRNTSHKTCTAIHHTQDLHSTDGREICRVQLKLKHASIFREVPPRALLAETSAHDDARHPLLL